MKTTALKTGIPAAGVVAVAFALSACMTTPGSQTPLGFSPRPAASQNTSTPDPQPLSATGSYDPAIGALAFPSRTLSVEQERLLAGARYVLGKSRLEVQGRSFTYDCSGTILAIYYYAGIDLAARFDRYTGGGVERIYKIMQANHLLYTTYYPQPGDIVFWDNTYDENGDGLWNDELTHAGMVVGVGSNGEISYIHQNYAKGIVIEKMNLLYPNIYTRILGGMKVTINSPMRMKGSPPGPDWLSGQLYRDLGRGYLLKG
jgi:probable lipoprotein NlpC